VNKDREDEEVNGCEMCGIHGFFYFTKGLGFVCDDCKSHDEDKKGGSSD